MNAELAGDWPERLKQAVSVMESIKKSLRAEGWILIGDEPMKLTLNAAERGYTGMELQEVLRKSGIECEFTDRQYLVLMPSPDTSAEEWERLETALRFIPQREPQRETPPALP